MTLKKMIRFLFLGITFLLVGTLLVLVISNLTLDTTLENPDQLSQEEKIMIQETENLVDTFGNDVFPGFGDADIPMIIYNAEYAYLMGADDPADGWVKVPQEIERGAQWNQVAGETLLGMPYYQQALPDPDTTPEAFAVRIGDQWAYSLLTYDWMRISLVEVIQSDLPGFLKPIFPYRLFTNQLVRGQDHYITALVHERFHAFQGMSTEDKFSQTEITNYEQQDNYPWYDEQLEADWKAELNLLADAMKQENPETVEALAQEFLAMRAERRAQAGLSDQLAQYEQQREWLEGLARYTELKIWQRAESAGYSGLPETSQLSEFDGYQKFDARWDAELKQFPQMADDEGDGRFYYSGMAQAVLLDQLMPEWKTRTFEDGVWLEDLLAEAVQ